MKRRTWVILPALILPIFCATFWAAQHIEPSSSAAAHRAVLLSSAPTYAGPSPDEVLDASDTALRVAQEAADAAEAVRVAQERERAPQAPVVVASYAPHSEAFWRGLAQCEESGTNHPYFGFFAVMDGSAGGLPWDVQVGIVNAIIGRYGDGAWAASCIRAGYRASPDG